MERHSQITLRDLDSRQLVNSLVPWGEATPSRSSLVAYDQEVLRTGKPVVADHFVGIVGRTSQTAVVVPIRATIGSSISSASRSMSSGSGACCRTSPTSSGAWPPIDRNGRVVTRTRGGRIRRAQGPRADPRGAGSQSAASCASPLSTARPRSRPSRRRSFGWTVASGITLDQYHASLGTALGIIALGSVLLLLLAIGGAGLLARRISAPILALEQAGGQLLRGEAITRPQRATREVDAVAVRWLRRGRSCAAAKRTSLPPRRGSRISSARWTRLLRRRTDPRRRGPSGRLPPSSANSAFERRRDWSASRDGRAARVLARKRSGGCQSMTACAGRHAGSFRVPVAQQRPLVRDPCHPHAGAVDQVAIVSNDITDRKAVARRT